MHTRSAARWIPTVGLALACGGEGGGVPGGGASGDVEFADLPGRMRVANFVSNGQAGVPLELRWGLTLAESEVVGTVGYGEVTEFLAPRRPTSGPAAGLLGPEEASFFLVREGEAPANPSGFLVSVRESFDADTALTYALASTENSFGDSLVVSVSSFLEHKLPLPGSTESHVYAWSGAFGQIPAGDFVEVAAEATCGPPRLPAAGNVGEAAVLSPGASGLFLADSNTECATGSSPATGSLVAGRSYVLLGKADTFDLAAREAVMLELSVGR